jgi:dihydroorotate dehydrogenase electron transfer subunit
VKLLDAELLETREFLPRQWLHTYSAPWLAAAAKPGQFVHMRTPDYSGLVLRRPFSLNTFDRQSGKVTIHFRVTGRGTEWLARMRPGDRAEMLGPLGRGFEVDPKSRHVLLVAGGLGMAGVRSLVDSSLAEGRRVLVLFGALSAAEVYPSTLLPPEAEYIVATDDGSFGFKGRVTELVPKHEAWADQCFACGPQPMLSALANLARGRDGRLGVARLARRSGGRTRTAELGSPTARRRSWLQVSMEQNMGCAVGACLGCVIPGVEGPQRVCREGPVFAAQEIRWEGWA